jgi:tetratricopeptide (TPR) repeat protein
MKLFTFVTLLLLTVSAFISSSYSQTVENLIGEGDKYDKEFDHQKALETYLKADEMSPANWEIIWRISRAYVNLGAKMPEEADEEEDAKIEVYEKSFAYADSSVMLAPDQSIPYVRRAISNGRIVGNGGSYYQSLAHYVLGRTHAKVCEKVYLFRLPIGLGWGDMDVAIREFQIAVKLKPNFRMYHLELAKAYIEEDEYELAKENLLLVQKAPRILEDDEKYLQEAVYSLQELESPRKAEYQHFVVKMDSGKNLDRKNWQTLMRLLLTLK